MSNSLDPDQDRHSVIPDLGPNCLQRLTADDKNQLLFHHVYITHQNSYEVFVLFLFVCFVALRPKSTAMVMAGRSVHLTTLFPGQA